MAEYIFTERNGIYIIDLQKTVKKLEEAYNFLSVRQLRTAAKSFSSEPKSRLSFPLKKRLSAAVCLMLTQRWLGGMLTNFTTIRRRIDRLNQLRKMREDGTFDLLPKKEVIKLNAEIEKLEKIPRRYSEHEENAGRNVCCRPQKRKKLPFPKLISSTFPLSPLLIPTAIPMMLTMLSPATMTLSVRLSSFPALWPMQFSRLIRGAVGSAEVADQEAEEAAE